MITKERIEQIKKQTAEFIKRQNEKPAGVWSPTISEEERSQREQDIKNGVIPF